MKKFICLSLLLLSGIGATHAQSTPFTPQCLTNMVTTPTYQANDKDKLDRRARVLCRTNYVSYFDPMTKTPLWVAEKVELTAKAERVNDFQPDPDVPLGAQAALNDYKNSKFDRGHMAPAADMTSDKAMQESFYLTNMVPQVGPNMNRGIWADLETTVRKIAEREGAVYVFTGPIFDSQTQTIGRSKVWVPTELYKIIYRPKNKQIMAYIIPNKQIVTRKTKTLDPGNSNYPQTTAEAAINCKRTCDSEDFRVDIKEVEAKTKFKFFN